jgi:hypothetical protein
LDAAIAFAVVTLMAACLLQILHSQQDAVAGTAGLPCMLSEADSEVRGFTATAYAGAPGIAPSPGTTTDAGQGVQVMRATAFNPTLGLRTYAVSVFVPGGPRAVLAGAARLETLNPPAWVPDLAGSGAGSTAQVLTVTTATPYSGSVAGTGTYLFGTAVPITATPVPGHAFVQWTGTAIIANPMAATTTVTLDDDRTVTALFSP